MFNHFKTNSTISLRIRLFDSAGLPVTGVAQGSTAVALLVPAGTSSALTVSTEYTWAEVSTGAFASLGVYLLEINASVCTTAGEYTLAVTGGTGTAVAEFSAYTQFPADVYSRIGAPVNASISADVAAVKSAVGSPASSLTVDVAAVSAKLGTPAAVTVSADVAAVKSDTLTVQRAITNGKL